MLTLFLGILQVTWAELSANGSHVCANECRKLSWNNVDVYRPCGYPRLKKKCKITVRKPEVKVETCYECCEGWRQTDASNCDTKCISGPAGILSCEELPDGWYQLCESCDSFAHCQHNVLLRMPCPKKLQWDDRKKMCVRHSKTCKLIAGNDDKKKSVSRDLPDETARDKGNEVTNLVDIHQVSHTGKDCSSITCTPPGRCIMLFSASIYTMTPKCICPPGSTHTAEGACASLDECKEKSPCVHGVCRNRRRGGFKCRCDPEWRGRRCDRPRHRGRLRKTRHRTSEKTKYIIKMTSSE